MLRFMFWVYLKVPAILRVPGTPPVSRYIPGSWVYLRVSVTRPGLRYMSRFMFWLYFAILRVPGIPPDVKYTSWSQVHVALHVLGIFEDTCNLPGPRYTHGSYVDARVS